MINAKTLATIRTCQQLNKPVYFYFEGDLFLDNNKTIEKITKFRGFNCATRQEDNFITSYEYVKFNSNIPYIFNTEVNFRFKGSYYNIPSLGRFNNISLAIPVNRDDYRALEHFTFTYRADNLNVDTQLAWTRFSEPRVEEEKALGYRWVYCGYGFKTYSTPKEEFPEFDFVKGELR